MSRSAPTLRDALWRCAFRIAYPLYAFYCAVLRPRVRSGHVLVWVGDRLLVVGHSYNKGLSAPAGRARRREPAAACAARELAEEVGLELGESALRLVDEFTTRCERAVDRVHVFEARLDAAPELAIDHREIVWAGFRSLEELHGEVLRPTFTEILARRAP